MFLSAKSAVGSLQTKTVTPASLSSSPAIINLNNTLQACIDGTGGKQFISFMHTRDDIHSTQRIYSYSRLPVAIFTSKRGIQILKNILHVCKIFTNQFT